MPVAANRGIPAELLRLVNADWLAVDEAPPASWPGDACMWRRIQAHKRRRTARVVWAAAHGADYLGTFHPEWRTGR